MVPDRYQPISQFPSVAIQRHEEDLLREVIARWRTEAGLSQRELSRRLNRPHNYMVKLELGQRAVTFIELLDILEATGRTPIDGIEQYLQELEQLKLGGSNRAPRTETNR